MGSAPAPPSGPITRPQTESAPLLVRGASSRDRTSRGFSGKSRFALVAVIAKLNFQNHHPGIQKQNNKQQNPTNFRMQVPEIRLPVATASAFLPLPWEIPPRLQECPRWVPVWTRGGPREAPGGENPGHNARGALALPDSSPRAKVATCPCRTDAGGTGQRTCGRNGHRPSPPPR